MRLFFRILLPFLILAACVGGAWIFISKREAPKQRPTIPQITQVEAETLQPTDYQVYLPTRGTVVPRTTTTLFPEVAGKVEWISPNFREGSFFEKGEALLRLEKYDYETALISAKSQLAQAKRALEEEKARGTQAAENWKRLGKYGTPSDMVLRVPQREEAEARVEAAQASLERAHRDLERTEVRAPYAGRILEQRVDVGQYLSPNTQLGRAFATDIMEVRLPLTNNQLAFVELPENYRGESAASTPTGPEVEVTAKIGRQQSTWTGKIVRVDSSIDTASRQLFVVAEIADPYRREAGGAPLKIGMYVDAKVKGDLLRDVLVLPRSTVRVSGEVVLIDQQSRIERREVTPVWQGTDEIVIPADGSAGIKAGERLCLTNIAYPVNGAQVIATIDGVKPKVENIPGVKGKGEKGSKGKGKGGKGKKGGAE